MPLNYSQKLIDEGKVSDDEVQLIENNYKKILEDKLARSKDDKSIVITPFMDYEWKGFKRVKEKTMLNDFETNVSRTDLTTIVNTITSLPKDFNFLRKIEKLIGDRKKMFFESNKLDWAMGELLAYGSLLKEGYNVRISGQDVERGTFSHRHAVLKTEDSEEEIILLKNISKDQGNFNIYNSSLSEYGVGV